MCYCSSTKGLIRKFVLLSVSALLLICVVLAFTALTSTDNEVESLYDENRYREVQKVIDQATYLQEEKELDNVTYGQPYCFYYVSANAFQTRAETGESLRQDLSDRCDWIVPTSGKAWLHVYKINKKWDVAVGDYSSEACNEENVSSSFVSFSEIANYMETLVERGETITDPPVCVYISSYHTYLVCFRSNKDSYVIPYAFRPDFTGLKNGTCYQMKEAADVLNARYPLDTLNE